jgi:hypothetical protein
MITTSTEPDKDLTVHMVTGQVRGEELLEASLTFLREAPTRLALWDFSDALFSALSTQDLVSVFDALMPYVDSRRGGRSALLFTSTVGFGLGRLSEALAEVRNYPYEFKAFTNRKDALLWLDLPVGNGDPEEDEGAA